MGIYTIRLPDVGEGVAEAELVEWHVKLGDFVTEDDVVAAVMTDKAAVEVPSSASGTVTWLAGEIGEMVPVGGKLLQLSVAGAGNDTEAAKVDTTEMDTAKEASNPIATIAEAPAVNQSTQQTVKPIASESIREGALNDRSHRHQSGRAAGTKPLAAPSVRARAREEGINLSSVQGSGPAGRVSHQDLNEFIESDRMASASQNTSRVKRSGVKEIKMIGMRRKIAEKMAISTSRIPHITIVEEVAMTELEELRAALNKKYLNERPKLTLLPFLMRAIVEAVRDQPELNARYDDEAGVVYQHEAVNIGVATQTDHGLNVTVVQNAEAGSLWSNAQTISTLAEAARDGSIKRQDLSNGTITITSLGALGAIATTPIINHPEVAIIGINKMQIRPMWDGQQFQPCNMMNISCSFDHRVIDGWNAAMFVQKLKTLLETPAMLFVEA